MIVAAAIRTHDGKVHSLPQPARHADVERSLLGSWPFGQKKGFVDEAGNFMDRIEAMQHAKACSQLKPRNQPVDPIGAKPRLPARDELYSEDLW